MDLTPYFDSDHSGEFGSGTYPTRRVRAYQAYAHVVYVWRLTRVEWFSPDESGTSWGATDRQILVKGVAA